MADAQVGGSEPDTQKMRYDLLELLLYGKKESDAAYRNPLLSATTLRTKQVVKQQENVPGNIFRYSTALIFYPLISKTKLQFIDHHLTYCMIPCMNVSRLVLLLVVNMSPVLCFVLCL